MKKTKIIIIVPCYNVEKYIRECIESLLNQTKEDFIIICVDDKSTDKTLDVLKEIKKEFTTGQKIKEDSFLILENKVNKKVSRTINEVYIYIYIIILIMSIYTEWILTMFWKKMQYKSNMIF
jgi:glycosyltransferase involved in cell wall biosynthesis